MIMESSHDIVKVSSFQSLTKSCSLEHKEMFKSQKEYIEGDSFIKKSAHPCIAI